MKILAFDRFWSKVDVRGPDECWEWTGYRNPQGYGTFGVTYGDNRKAHRVAWELTNGPIPEGMYALHGCDNRTCCNPDHLYLGMHADNMADRARRGRTAVGENNGLAKLTAEKVFAIREHAAGGVTYKELARRYGVHRTNISLIVRRKTWRHI